MTKENKKIFNKCLLNWYAHNKRNLSFRKTKDPYKIMVSEIMAQQTQISSMEHYFNRFIEKFPTIHDLAAASQEEVFSLWEGLGYYKRARNLHKASIIIDSMTYFPQDYNELIKLPGIGPYTAGAIASIAFNQNIPSIDANALRVFSRLYNISEPVDKLKTKTLISTIVQEHLNDTTEPGDFNQAVMELGALICTKTPKCHICPLNKFCKAYQKETQNNLPIREKNLKKKSEYYDVLILLYKGKPLYYKRNENGMLSGLFGFPMKSKSNKNKSEVRYLLDYFGLKNYKYVGESKHVFTHKIWYSSVFIANVNEIPNNFTDNPSSVPTAFKKMLDLINFN